VEDIVTALKGYKCFKEVSEGKLEKNKDGSKVQFRLDIQIECPEEGST
jgi:general secretion pathway protein L